MRSVIYSLSRKANGSGSRAWVVCSIKSAQRLRRTRSREAEGPPSTSTIAVTHRTKTSHLIYSSCASQNRFQETRIACLEARLAATRWAFVSRRVVRLIFFCETRFERITYCPLGTCPAPHLGEAP